MTHASSRRASGIPALLLAVAMAAASCGSQGDDDGEAAEGDRRTPVQAPAGGNGGNGSGGESRGGAPGIPSGNSGGGAPGAPIRIPAIQQVGAISVDAALGILEPAIRGQCGGDLCVALPVARTGDGDNCTTFGGTRPPTVDGAVVDRGSTLVVLASCEDGDGGGENGGEDEGDGDATESGT